MSRSNVTFWESLSGVSASRSHWNAPPALSDTPMMCQRPGSLPAPTWTRPSGLSGQRDSPPATIPAVPIVKPAEPSSIRPIAVVWMTASPPPPNTGVPAGRPQAAHRSSASVPVCSIDSTTSGSSDGSTSILPSSSVDHVRCSTSNSPVPEASETSVAKTPVIR